MYLTKDRKMTEETTTKEPTTQEVIEQFVNNSNTMQIVTNMVQQKYRIEQLEADKKAITSRLQEERNVVRNNRDTVRNKFEEMLDGDKDATIEMDLDAINELLEDIGASPIRFTWSVDVKVTATITGIEAQSEEEAREKVLRAIELRVETDRLGDNADVDDEDYEVDNVEEETN
jgi:chromosome condensin MukBEF ATPase and DNA-binding subunit MukB